MKVKFLDLTHTHRPLHELMKGKFEELLNNNLYILGEHVERFEEAYAAYCNVKYCTGVANGLDALTICLKLLNIKQGDEVIVPSNTYIATWLAVSVVGATPVPAESCLNTYNIDPQLIEEAITPRTKGIIPVHLFGQPCEMDAIISVAQKYNIAIVEDNAQAHGAKYKNKPTGSFGVVNATSFYPTKNLGALGDAGAITTDSEELSKRSLALRNYGSREKNYNEERGMNSRLDEIQAAFLEIKLAHLDQWNMERNSIAEKYAAQLKGVGDLVLPEIIPEATSVFHQYVIRTGKRNELQKFLSVNEIETSIHYPVPPHLQRAYAELNYKKGDLPVAEEIAKTCLSLPIYPGLTDEQIDHVVEKIRRFYHAV